MERKALYNLLRMNWQFDPKIPVEEWQVEDYRSKSTDKLLEMLEEYDIQLDKSQFLGFANQCDTPEDLHLMLVDESGHSTVTLDKIYLVIFELWRRLVPEKPTLSILCDEVDHQIHQYDLQKLSSFEPLVDAIYNLKAVLDENTDQGGDPHEVFNAITAQCAHDIETFLYDFIFEQIENNNSDFAIELLDSFDSYIQDRKWFDFLRARALANVDSEESNKILHTLVENSFSDQDLEFQLELLSLLSTEGDQTLFLQLVLLTLPLIEHEEDFQDLLTICIDFYHLLDQELIEKTIHSMLAQRAHNSPQNGVSGQDPHIQAIKKIIEKSSSMKMAIENE